MANLSKGKELINRYVVDEVLGIGGTANVWKATDKELGRDVALKRLNHYGISTPTEEQAVELIEEAKKTAQISHKNIVQIFDVIEAELEHFIVMEYLGRTLASLIRDYATRAESIPLDMAIDILHDILEGVAFAHSKGICHRDLTPKNILLSSTGVAKIADFGTAKIIGNPGGHVTKLESLSGGGTGNPSFMSPEQARGEPADYSSDCFMVGIIGYLVLTGKHPFLHPSGLFDISELLKDVNYVPETPRSSPEATPSQQKQFREYATIVMRLLHRERSGRFESALKAMEAIEAVTPSINCPTCAESVPEGNIYCGRCGNKVDKSMAGAKVPAKREHIESLVNAGFREAEQKNWAAAVELYQQALQDDPNHKRAHRNLGFAFNRMGLHEKAIEILSKGIPLHIHAPDHPTDIYCERSIAFASLNRYKEALSDINSALKYSTNSPKLHFQKSKICSFMGDFASAQAEVQIVLGMVPNHAGALRMLESLSKATK